MGKKTVLWYIKMGSKIFDTIEAETQKEALKIAHKKFGIEIKNHLMSAQRK